MQTAASLTALFSVFIVFKIENINSKINSIRGLIIKIFIGIKNNETTPGAETKINKEFCDKFSISYDKHTYEKYDDMEILKMFNVFWNNRGNFLGASIQFGNDLVTEESLKLFATVINNKRIIIHRLVANLILSVSIIIFASMFLSFPSEWRIINFVYIMVLYIAIAIIYNAYSIYSIIRIK
ncbi:MAG: hypothetical protein Q8O59_00305 [bacterium]|nr:hypothetical protein [bacterium]